MHLPAWCASKPAIVPTLARSATAVAAIDDVDGELLLAAVVSGLLLMLPRNDDRKPENSSADRLPLASVSYLLVIALARSWMTVVA